MRDTLDVYFGPTAPAGKASNWIQTLPGKGWFTILRLYGALEPWFDKTWRPGEILSADSTENTMNTKIASVAGASAKDSVRQTTSKENIANITEPRGGKPAPGAKPSVPDLNYQVAYQRAFEAVIWSMPAVCAYGFHRGAMNIGATDNTVLSWSQPATPNAELLTANNQSPYVLSQTDLRHGAVVIEVPAATDKASLYGQITDHWQLTIADVGPSGLDQGKGGKFLLTPPGYNGAVPAGYTEVKSPSYRVCFAIRSVKGPNATTEDAAAYARSFKMYFLDDPKPTRFIDPANIRFATLPVYDERYFEDVYAIVSVENSSPRDKVMIGMLASLGIEKGKPYNPDDTTKQAMRQGVIDAYFYLLQRFIHPDESKIWWRGKHWYDGLFADANREFRWETDAMIELDNRADRYFSAANFPRRLPQLPATQYLFALADKDGNELQAGTLYSFVMPARVPVKQFWSLIIYDLETFAFIYNPQRRPGLSSFDLPNITKNPDGSTTLYFGPQPPAGLESNWIPTSGKRPLPTVRIYGGTEEFWDRSWAMPDVERVL